MTTNHEGGEHLHSSPEEREQLQINAVVIPANESELPRQHQLAVARLVDYQELVGGLIEGVALDKPPARMYMNEEGKLRDLPINRRATLLLWAHNRPFRYQDVIMGDAFLVGQPDREGSDTSVPEHYAHLLCEASTFHVEVQAQSDETWREMQGRFDNWPDAYEFALTLERSGYPAADFRVVPES
jgi:hypothetical protein